MKVNFKELLGKAFAPLVTPLIKPLTKLIVSTLLDSFWKTNQEHCAVLVVSGYPIVDVELETLAEKTGTELDDALVDGLKEAFESFAEEHELDLENLDQD